MPSPQEDPVKKALDSAKKTIAGANKFEKSAGGPLPAAPAKGVTDKPADVKPPKKPTSEGLLGDMGSAAAGIKVKKENVDQYNKANPDSPLKSYDKGGKVEKTGPAKLDKGETVLPAGEKNKKKAEKLAMDHLGKKASAMAQAAEEEDNDSGMKTSRKVNEEAEAKQNASAEKAMKELGADEKKEVKKHKVKGIHFRHGKSGGYIAKHDLMPSEDGSIKPGDNDPEEHVLPTRDAMHKHIDTHFADGEDLPSGAPEGE